MKYAAGMKDTAIFGAMTTGQGSQLPCTRRELLVDFEQKHGAALHYVQSFLLALDGSRLFNLLEECRLVYGRRARERAVTTLHRWREGQAIIVSEEMDHLITLLVHHLTPEEKIDFLRGLRHEWIASLPKSKVRVTAMRGDDLISIACRVAGSVRSVQASMLPVEFLAVLGWPTDIDAQALAVIVFDAEKYIAVHRLAAMMVQLATLGRLSALASPQVTVRVQAHLEVPTLIVDLNFLPCFLLDMITSQGDPGLLLRLQNVALQQAVLDSSLNTTCCDFAVSVREGLSPAEYAHLGALALGLGIRVDSLLKEIEAQTLAARADIEATIAIAERMKAEQVNGKVVSEHTAPFCTARIEIKQGVCPIASIISLLTRFCC